MDEQKGDFHITNVNRILFPVFHGFANSGSLPSQAEPGDDLVIGLEEIWSMPWKFTVMILLTILGGLICLFDNFVFKSRMPRHEDFA